MQHSGTILWLALLLSCGPVANPGDPNPDGNPGSSPDAFQGDVAALTGTVWAPGQTPGMVPPGHEIPVYGAAIIISPERQPPIPQETYCEPCVDPEGRYTFSSHDGTFALANLAPGDYWLTIQKGQFRLEQQVLLIKGQVLELRAEKSTLPSINDPNGGKWTPRIAMAVGLHDKLEAILGKMGMGAVDAQGNFDPTSAAGIMDIYTNGPSFAGATAGTLGDLVSDLSKLLRYHVVFIPCSGAAHTAALSDERNLRNIRDFVAAGGKLYVTDWSGEWADNVFPAQITLGPLEDTPAEAYDPATDTWNVNAFGDADGDQYDSKNAEVVDSGMYDWLSGQQGPVADDYSLSMEYDPGLLTITGNWNYIESLNRVEIGSADGVPVYDVPKAYVVGGVETSPLKRPLTVTFEPAGCGRVLYSTYHTTDMTHNGLVPQERVLLYLIMEIGECLSGPIIL